MDLLTVEIRNSDRYFQSLYVIYVQIQRMYLMFAWLFSAAITEQWNVEKEKHRGERERGAAEPFDYRVAGTEAAHSVWYFTPSLALSGFLSSNHPGIMALMPLSGSWPHCSTIDLSVRAKVFVYVCRSDSDSVMWSYKSFRTSPAPTSSSLFKRSFIFELQSLMVGHMWRCASLLTCSSATRLSGVTLSPWKPSP